MFHFWFNTFFVAVDQTEHTATLKAPPDGRSRTPRSVTATSASVKQHSALPSSYVKSVPPSSSSSVIPRGMEHANNRTVDRVLKTAATRTSSDASSASSGTHSSVSYRRGSQQRDRPSVRPHSVHLSDTQTTSNHLDSAASSKVSQTSRGPRDKLQTSGSSTPSTAPSKPLQEPRNRPHAAPVLAGSRSKIASQERKNSISSLSSASQERKNSITSVSSARRGNAGSIRAVEKERSVSRSDSVKVSRPKGEIARTTPNHTGMLHTRTGGGGSQKPAEKNAVSSETADQQSELSSTTDRKSSITSVSSAQLMKTSTSTPVLSKATKADSATNHSVRQPNPSTKVPSGVSRCVQKDFAKRSLPPSKTGTSQRLVFSRQTSEQGVLKHSESSSSLVSPSVQARSEGLPSDPVSLTRFTPRNPRHYTAAGLVPNRKLLAPAESQSGSVYEVSGSSLRPETFCTLMLAKSEIDKANKDVQHKVYSADFKVSVSLLYMYTLCSLVNISSVVRS